MGRNPASPARAASMITEGEVVQLLDALAGNMQSFDHERLKGLLMGICEDIKAHRPVK